MTFVIFTSAGERKRCLEFWGITFYNAFYFKWKIFMSIHDDDLDPNVELDSFGELIERLPFCLPDDISPKTFLQDYWQKKPLLIRNGLPALVGMFEPADVLDLALEDGVSARLIAQKDSDPDQWTLKNSPLSESDLQSTPNLWTVLIQNLEQWSPELGQLWQAFDFIPKWQQDDIMVSVAPQGGSVGKHYDEYDVFLAQGHGTRRWQLGKMCTPETPFIPNQPIRLLDDMGEIVFDEVLHAGDVLYVPPCLSHYGVAGNDCLTFSFGFRRPNVVQLLDEAADIATCHERLFSPLQLPQALQDNPNALTDDSISAIKDVLINTLNSPTGNEIIRTAIAELVSRRQYDLLSFEDDITGDDLRERLGGGECLLINPASRFISVDSDWFVNGEKVIFDDTAQTVLITLLDGNALTFDEIDAQMYDVLAQWVNDNWVVLY